MEERHANEEGEAFIRHWYERIDAKVPFEEIARDTAGEGLVVDFPGKALDFKGFRAWYEGQCRDFTGKHQIHSIHVTEEEEEELVVFSEITWSAENADGSPITLRPNVTLWLTRPLADGRRKVRYYGCVDRE